jgi:hypothetical protein
VKRLTILDVESGQKFEANGIDISVKGIGFYSKKFFSNNSRVSIQVWLDDVSQKDPVWINAVVRWSKLEQDGAIIGVQFDTLIKPVEHPKLYEMIYNVMRVLMLGSTLL